MKSLSARFVLPVVCLFSGSLLVAVGCAESGGGAPPGANGSQNTSGGTTSASGGSLGTGGATASGGTGVVGGAGGSVGTGGGTGTCPTDQNLVLHGGWVGCDPTLATDNPQGLQGSFYMFGDGTSCTETPSPCGDAGCCISGATVVDPTYAAWGCGVGLELNSTGGLMSVKQPYAGTAKCFDITLTGNSGGNVVRISYTNEADMTGKVAPFLEVDPITSSWSGTVCFEDVQCPADWMPAPDCATGAQYDLQIQVVGAVAAGAYDLCLSSLVPHDGTGAGLTVLKQLCEDEEETSGGGYLFRNNVWNEAGGDQCITAKQGGGIASFTVDSSNHNVMTGEPAAYPSIVKGWHWGKWTADSGMPKAISAITSAPVAVDVAVPGSGRYNTAFDLWVGPDAEAATPAGGLEIMIWLNYAGAQPLGGKVADAVPIGDSTWDVWTGSVETWSYLAYVRTGATTTWNGDLKPFLTDAVTRSPAEDTWSLLSIQFGFEIWQSGSPFEVKSFSATVN